MLFGIGNVVDRERMKRMGHGVSEEGRKVMKI